MTIFRTFPRHAILLGALAAALLAGCAGRTQAPVIERGAPQDKVSAAASGDFYTVKKGDTLYSIALDHGQSHRDVAAWNNIENPNLIAVGQQLRITPPEGIAVAKPVAGPAVVEIRPLGATTASNINNSHKREPKGGKQPYSEQAVAQAQKGEELRNEPQHIAAVKPEGKPTEPAAVAPDLGWGWPINGKVIAGFSESGNKGIDIGGKIGDPVMAAEAGKVTYAGSGIRGYGNLLIIQHQNNMASVYAHNSKLLAKEGQMVSRGQRIAEVGNSDADQAKLHFEIRRQGKPLDPLRYLPPH